LPTLVITVISKMKSRVSSDRVILSSEKQDFYCTFLIGAIGVFFIFLKKAACTGKQKGEWI